MRQDVFMHQLEGFIDPTYPTHVCKLNKALYGLKQAPKAWYDRLKGFLVKWGFQASKSNTSLFIQRVGEDILLILIYVDDILITGSGSKHIDSIIHFLSLEFALKI